MLWLFLGLDWVGLSFCFMQYFPIPLTIFHSIFLLYIISFLFHSLLLISSKDGKLIRDLLMTLQNYGIQQGEALRNDASTSVILHNRPNVQLHVKYINHSELKQEERLFHFPNASFDISSDALPKDSGAVVAVAWYKTLNGFLTDSLYDKGDIDSDIDSTIISASVRPQPKRDLEEPVRISWDTKESVLKFACFTTV